MTTLLDIDHVTKTYRRRGNPDVMALSDVSLSIGDQEIVALIGPSGCGKSTLLRMIAGLDDDYVGSLKWSVPPRPGKDIGFVFQEATLLPWRSVSRNVALGLESQRMDKAARSARVEELLEMVGLRDFAQSYPSQLSGGMKQRVGILRALAYDPRVLLMDEPFGALDAITRDKLQDDLLAIWERTHKTIVLVTHSVEEAAYLADRVVVMSPRPGRIKSIHDVPFSRERSSETRQLPEFAHFTGMLREELG
ncbi:ABC transporter ATP-binding protein [Microbacterium sp. SORGH_AS_0862]|uniref:ABC transporter ATP-binding protein n=1 Tax=Microbacterium sp. SORGH_AS_0862 TaxID=3041789 RepID=UPI002790133B|nr:ABC transporter ATP-binding protein [Microbacterium sp. SORGH_AS_0862]MDQ1205275.1 NitT/TauT family transport system ATP-binding protein [Microbacterium sp. SORGH_AS_0862]